MAGRPAWNRALPSLGAARAGDAEQVEGPRGRRVPPPPTGEVLVFQQVAPQVGAWRGQAGIRVPTPGKDPSQGVVEGKGAPWTDCRLQRGRSGLRSSAIRKRGKKKPRPCKRRRGCRKEPCRGERNRACARGGGLCLSCDGAGATREAARVGNPPCFQGAPKVPACNEASRRTHRPTRSDWLRAAAGGGGERADWAAWPQLERRKPMAGEGRMAYISGDTCGGGRRRRG